MNDPLPEHDARLRALLRRGDPAADRSEPGPDEIASLRRRVLTAATPSAPAPRRWAAAAAALLVVVALAAEHGRRHYWQETVSAPATVDTAVPARQVHFQTPGGTRIVWVLRPASAL